MLDKPVLELLQATAQKAVAPQVIDMPGNPDQRIVLVNGEVRVIDTPRQPPDRNHVVKTFADLETAYSRWQHDGLEVLIPEEDTIEASVNAGADDESDEEVDPTQFSRLPAVWHSGELVQFFLDEPFRRSKVVLPLVWSDVWKTVKTFARPVTLDQKGLIRLLRHDLAGCVDPAVLSTFRSMNFQQMQNRRSSMQHGNNSIDADLVAQVEDAASKPEQFMIEFQPFAMRELETLRERVIVTIDIDVENTRFVLQALPDRLERVIEAASLFVRNALETRLPDGTDVLAGTP